MADATQTKVNDAAKAVADATVATVETNAKIAEKVVEASTETARKAVKRAAKPARRATKARKATTRKAAARKPAARKTTARANTAAPQFEGIKTMTYDANNFFANLGTLPGADKFQGLFADAGERSQELVRRSQQTAEELAEIAKANVEALTEAGRIAATGARSIGQDVLATSREGLEQASAAVKTLADAKSPTEFFQIQGELARKSFDRAVAEGSKITEQLVKLAGEAVQPLSNRASINAERINELAA